MSYTPPAGDAVDFDLAGSYTAPVGGAVDFAFAGDAVELSLNATTAAPTGLISILHGQVPSVTISASTAAPTAQLQLVRGAVATLAATTASPQALINVEFSNERRLQLYGVTASPIPQVQLVRGAVASISATTVAPESTLTVDWGVPVPRAVLNSSDAGQAAKWGRAAVADKGPDLAFKNAPAKQPDRWIAWQDAEQIDATPRLPFGVIPAKPAVAAVPWNAFVAHPGALSALDYSHPPAKQPQQAQRWDAFSQQLDKGKGQLWHYPPAVDHISGYLHRRVELWGNKAVWDTRDYRPPYRYEVDFSFAEASYMPPASTALDFSWGAASPYADQPIRPTDPGISIGHDIPPPVQESRTVTWGAGSWERPPPDYATGPGWNTEPDEPATPPPIPQIKEVYIFMPSLTLYRTPDGAEIEALNVSWTTDADSWGWRFSATLARASDLALLKPDSNGPKEIACEINGHLFTGLVESYGTSRQFGQSGYTIKGRSLSAYLSDPYAPLRSKAIDATYSARQLAEQELTNTGWTLNWQIPDWTVPAGAFSYQGKDAIAVIKSIADAAGATVQTDPGIKQLHIYPRYPVSPHLWANVGTPLDAILPAELIKTFGSEFRSLPKYNRSFVAGGPTGGVIVMLTRDGTAGDILSPQIVDGLITHSTVGYERARNELAPGGSWESLQLETWLTQQGDAPGLLLPGHLVEIQDISENYRAQISATTITAASTQDALTVRQQLTAERYNG
ncbi:hypothetical protein [Marinobacterium rhizophilum]|uniref:Phage tail protein n=1 Tax=Marinobacterium rhizophilum TaxID=420402 RepID=A0ABY5HM14_9GAMM|nr:hypothetical protein [Marinobacterium rhizophilum]UTW12926.1 hypothetical protein KDW95_04430 [Marinobacterium rhizophilum]